MKISHNTSGFSIIEVMVMVLIMTIATIAIYGLIQSSRRMSYILADRQVAINYARQGVEGVVNIRDTNWVKYPLINQKACWFASGYTCVNRDGTDKYPGGRYILTPGIDPSESLNQWYLKSVGIQDLGGDDLWIYLDNKGKPYQLLNTSTGPSVPCGKKVVKNCRTKFQRKVEIEYPVAGNDFGITSCWDSAANVGAQENCLRVVVSMYWRDTARQLDHQFSLRQLITNWDAIGSE